MIVVDLFIDIESMHEFQIHFVQIFKILAENRGPVMIEVPVGCMKSDSRLNKPISRPKISIWTNPVGIRSIGKRFSKKYISCDNHWVCNNPRPF